MYRVDCQLCPTSQQCYEGESYRPCHDRFGEHIRAANNPASYMNNAISKHYSDCHVNCESSKLIFTILDRQSSTARRKISEAIMISKHEPSINLKDELVDTMKFMLH